MRHKQALRPGYRRAARQASELDMVYVTTRM
jgi:hypothetical protein